MNIAAATFVLLLLPSCAFASHNDRSDFSVTAHVVGTARQRTRGGTTSSYNAQTGQWEYGTYSGSVQRQTELRVGNLVYVVNRVCKGVEVGADYPAKVDKKTVHLLLHNGKTCDAKIEATHEVEK